MRKTITLILICILCISLVACGSTETSTPTTGPGDSAPVTESDASSSAEEKEPDLEDWYAQNPDAFADLVGADGNVEVIVEGNSVTFKYDLSTVEGFTAETVKSKVIKDLIQDRLVDAQETFVADIERLETKSEVSDISYTVTYTFEDDPVASVTFTRSGVVEDSLG
ncbi:MAG: hypothetical protein IJ091_07775 [Oscillospiraceae bacterium]|nr:hypothetical protein [Oscillospiraceae bacterium]